MSWIWFLKTVTKNEWFGEVKTLLHQQVYWLFKAFKAFNWGNFMVNEGSVWEQPNTIRDFTELLWAGERNRLALILSRREPLSVRWVSNSWDQEKQSLCWPYSGQEPQFPDFDSLIQHIPHSHLTMQVFSQVPVAHACNPSYSGGRDQEDHSSKPAWTNGPQDPI
jgi:hypothetical protein